MIKLVNLTPHAITILGSNQSITIESSGVARVSSSVETVDTLNGWIPVEKSVFSSEVSGLPQSEDGVAYIVSLKVAQACPDRTDLYIVSSTVRDDSGAIIGCKALGQI